MDMFQGRNMRIPYSLRHIPREDFAGLKNIPETPEPGDVVLASLVKIAKNSTLELNDGRRCSLHEGDVIAAVFGNRYATLQFEGLAQRNGDACDLLSMGGLCGIVQSRHSKVAEPTKLRLLGAIADRRGTPLTMRNYRLPPSVSGSQPHVVVVCGSSMDAGKTFTAMNLIKGLRNTGKSVAGIKLTGTAAGKDTWNMLDAGACAALDFVDGGHPSTYLCEHDDLIALRNLLVGQAAAQGADYVVMEIADGLLQRETSMLLQSPAFTAGVDSWLFAGGDPMSAESGIRMMRGWGIEPVAVSGVLTMSKLNIREVEAATGMRCMTASELQSGKLNSAIVPDAHERNEVPLLRSVA
jgi:hypothetical protein